MSKLTSKERSIEVTMQGLPRAPESASGNTTPYFAEIAVESLTLKQADGTLVAIEDASSKHIRIVDQEQIVVRSDLPDISNYEFSGIVLSLDSTAFISAKGCDACPVTLTYDEYHLNRNFTLSESKGLHVHVGVEWRNIITTSEVGEIEKIESPAFDINIQ